MWHTHEQRHVLECIEVAVQIRNVVSDVGNLGIQKLELLLVQCTQIVQSSRNIFMVKEGARRLRCGRADADAVVSASCVT